MPAITCLDLTKTYGKTDALHKLNCTLAEDAITGIIGPNGAGKTTLLKCIAGYYRPSSGTLRVFDRDPYDDLTLSAAMVFVDETMTFPDGQTLGQIFASCRRFYTGWDQPLAEKLLDYFSLPADRLPQALSKGMLSTFRSIIGLCVHTPLTVLDEPTTGMDSGVRQDFYRALLKDYLAHPRTILISSHLLAEIEDLLEYLLLIDQGSAILSAPVTELASYALTLSGRTERLQPLLEKRTILRQEAPLSGYLTATVVNDLTPAEQASLADCGITSAAVSLSDLCIILTARNKGGIDHVFA